MAKADDYHMSIHEIVNRCIAVVIKIILISKMDLNIFCVCRTVNFLFKVESFNK